MQLVLVKLLYMCQCFWKVQFSCFLFDQDSSSQFTEAGNLRLLLSSQFNFSISLFGRGFVSREASAMIVVLFWKTERPSEPQTQNLRMVCIGRDLNDHLIPTLCHGQEHLPLDQIAKICVIIAGPMFWLKLPLNPNQSWLFQAQGHLVTGWAAQG